MAIENMWEIGDHVWLFGRPTYIVLFKFVQSVPTLESILLDMNPMKLTTHDTLVY